MVIGRMCQESRGLVGAFDDRPTFLGFEPKDAGVSLLQVNGMVLFCSLPRSHQIPDGLE